MMSETVEGLQEMLNTLSIYTEKWGLSVNTKKTKIVVFRKGGIVRPNETWVYNGQTMDIVEQFCYLGVLIRYNCKFLNTQKHCAEQGRKAMFSMRRTTSSLCLNVFTMLSLFDTYVCSILMYVCEIWGVHKSPMIEKVHFGLLQNVIKCQNNGLKCDGLFEIR